MLLGRRQEVAREGQGAVRRRHPQQQLVLDDLTRREVDHRLRVEHEPVLLEGAADARQAGARLLVSSSALTGAPRRRARASGHSSRGPAPPEPQPWTTSWKWTPSRSRHARPTSRAPAGLAERTRSPVSSTKTASPTLCRRALSRSLIARASPGAGGTGRRHPDHDEAEGPPGRYRIRGRSAAAAAAQPEGVSTRSTRAMATSWARVRACTLDMALRTCVRTVSCDTNIPSAISRLVCPRAS